MVRQHSVSGKKSNGNPYVRCAAISIILATVLLLVAPSGPTVASDNLRTGQAQHVGQDQSGYAGGSTGSYSSSSGYYQSTQDTTDAMTAQAEYNADSSQEIRGAFNNAVSEMKSAEEAELAKSSSTLSAAVQTAGSFVYSGMKALLTSSEQGGTAVISDQEISEMATEVQDRLNQNVQEELREKADSIVADEEDKMDESTQAEEKAGLSPTEIEQDVYKQEEIAVSTIQEQIGSTATDLQQQMRAKAQEMEKQILEERLSKRLGKKVKLMIVEDEISGVEELLQDLSVLKGGEVGSGTSIAQQPVAAAAMGSDSGDEFGAAPAQPADSDSSDSGDGFN